MSEADEDDSELEDAPQYYLRDSRDDKVSKELFTKLKMRISYFL